MVRRSVCSALLVVIGPLISSCSHSNSPTSPGTTAGTPVIFSLSGSLTNGAALSGTITIDTTADLFTAVNVVVGAPINLTFIKIALTPSVFVGGSTIPILRGVSLAESTNTDVLNLYVPVSTLVNYRGGSLCPGPAACTGVGASGLVGPGLSFPAVSVVLTPGS
jgi:hypothetical protein